MNTPDFTTAILVDQTREQAFNAVNNVRGWWSEEIEGNTQKLNEEFSYHYEDVHNCKMQLVEIIPNKKVVWLVKQNYFKFTKDKSEWTGTRITFDISEKGSKTEVRMTHHDLNSKYECFDICSNAWTKYIQQSLFNLITTGKGKPNATGKPRTEDERKLAERKEQDYSISISVKATAKQAFKSINSVTKWWTENLEGSSQKLNDEFTVRFGDVHVSTQKLVEVIPDKRVVWLVTDSNLNFVENKNEWTGTKISFDLSEKNGTIEVRFTHQGLGERECFDACSNVWSEYIQQSLLNLINTGKGQPTLKESNEKAEK